MKIPAPLFISLLILLNAVPVYGVFEWDWQSFDLIFLYWFENLIIGFFMILRIVIRKYSHPAELAMPLFMAPFFTVHYGMFCMAHGAFVMQVFGGELSKKLIEMKMEMHETVFYIIETQHLLIPVAALFVYQLIDWLREISERGFGSEGINEITTAPYRRIFILHVTIIASGFVIAMLDEPTIGLLVLILFKTGMDIYHLRKDEKAATDKTPAELDEKIKKKIDAYIDSPRLTINGKITQFKNFEELKNSNHYKLMRSMAHMIGGSKQIEQAEKYIAEQIKQREFNEQEN